MPIASLPSCSAAKPAPCEARLSAAAAYTPPCSSPEWLQKREANLKAPDDELGGQLQDLEPVQGVEPATAREV